MPLRHFITQLEATGQLRRIAAPIQPELELAAITDRICKGADGGPALLFEQVTGSRIPVVTNLFGSSQRTALALNSDSLDHFGTRIEQSLREAGGQNSAEKLRNLLGGRALQPAVNNTPACREVLAATDLSIIPALKFWPGETVPSLTLPLVFTTDPDTGEQNCGMYRVQIHNADRATINFGSTSGGAQHLRGWQEKGEPMPVAIVLGGAPALVWAAGAPLPKGCDEMRLAAWVTGSRPAVTLCLNQPLQIPADAEIVIEGLIRPGETGAEGPFGNHTGGYVANPAAPVLRVTAISHRRDALCPATLVGPPPMEDCWLAKASEKFILAMLQIDYPQIRDLHLPLETIFHGCALIAVEGIHSGEGTELLRALRSSGPLQRAKLLILLDSDIDLRNPSLAYWRTINCLDENRLRTHKGQIDIDATGATRRVEHNRETQELVSRRWSEYELD